jgi:tRNA-2-methylthio-N6-dimethylallyladenosine synthase
VLIEKEARRGGLLQARTRDFKTVIVPGDAALIGSLRHCRAHRYYGSTFTGAVVNERLPLPMAV